MLRRSRASAEHNPSTEMSTTTDLSGSATSGTRWCPTVSSERLFSDNALRDLTIQTRDVRTPSRWTSYPPDTSKANHPAIWRSPNSNPRQHTGRPPAAAQRAGPATSSLSEPLGIALWMLRLWGHSFHIHRPSDWCRVPPACVPCGAQTALEPARNRRPSDVRSIAQIEAIGATPLPNRG